MLPDIRKHILVPVAVIPLSDARPFYIIGVLAQIQTHAAAMPRICLPVVRVMADSGLDT